MGNFTRRVIAFIMGMVVMLVTLLGGVAGTMYWAFKNLSLSKIGVMQDDNSGIADATIEDLVALVLLVQSDPESFTIAKLEEQGIDVLQLLGTLGVDLSKADSADYENLKNISPLLLFSGEGLYQISFSTIFAFLPKGEDGTYPIFSEGARNMLRGYSLGYLLETDYETGAMRLFSELGVLKIGSLFPNMFIETYDEENSEYVYTAESPAIEKLGNLKISLLTKVMNEEEPFDIGYELHNGELKEIGELGIADFLSDLIAGDDEELKEQAKESFFIVADLLVKDLFAYDDEQQMYVVDLEQLLSNFSIGTFMGYVKCTENENCSIHKGIACDGNWYERCSNSENCIIHGDTGCEGKEKYKAYSNDTAEGLITKNLINLNVQEIMAGGFEISAIVDGVYLGHSLGYTISTNAPAGYCNKDCAITESHTEHTYYWVDGTNSYVGKLYNDMSNIALVKALNGEGIDLEGIVVDSRLGELLGKYNKNGAWYDDSNCTIPVSNETAMDKILLSIYDKTMGDISNGSLDLGEMLDNIKMGELMGYTYENGAWYDGNELLELTELNKSIYDMEVSKLVNGEMEFDDVLDGLLLGELMGYTNDNGVWKDGNEVLTLTELDKALYDVEVSKILNGEFEVNDVLDGLLLGELMGYTYDNGVWYDDNNVALTLTELDKALYDVEVSKIVNGEFEIGDVLDGLLLGELMGYTYDNGVWYDENNEALTLTELDKALYDVEVSKIVNGEFEINDVLDGLLLGELMGYTCDNGVWKDGEEALTLTKLDKAIYDVEVSKIVNGEFEIKDVLDGLLLGELMGYTYDDGAWYDESKVLKLTAFDRALYKVEVSKILDGEIEVGDILDGLYLGELMSYEIKAEEGYCDKDCVLDGDHKHNFYWVDSNGAQLELSEIDKALYRADVSTIIDGEFEIGDVLDGLKMGELMGYKIKAETGYCDKDCVLDGDHKHEYYWVDENGAQLKLNELDKALYRMDASKILDGEFVVDDILEGLKMGELMGYTYDNGVWYKDVECTDALENVTAMDKIMISIYGKTMDEIKGEDGTGLKLEDLLDGIMLGELMDHVYYEGVWYKGEIKAENVVTFNKFDKTLYETLVSELVTGEKDFKAILGDLYVGELMGNSYEGGVWYKENGDLLELGILDKTIYEVPVADILNNNVDFKDVLGDLYVGQLMNYTGSVGAWEKDGVPVSNLDMTVADIQLSEIFSGNVNFKSKIDNLTLGDVIDTDSADTPTILKLLKDTQVSQISTKMNELELGEVMGYIKCSKDANCEIHANGVGCDGKWYRENKSVVDGLNAKIANYTFKKFADEGFDANEFTLGDVIKEDSEYEEGSIFYLLDVGHIDGLEDLQGATDTEKRKNIPVSEVSKRTQSGVKKATLQELMGCGMFTLSPEEQAKLTGAFTLAGKGDWKALTMQQFISTIIGMISE